jgi:hypothetical protein
MITVTSEAVGVLTKANINGKVTGVVAAGGTITFTSAGYMVGRLFHGRSRPNLL